MAHLTESGTPKGDSSCGPEHSVPVGGEKSIENDEDVGRCGRQQGRLFFDEMLSKTSTAT